MEPAPGLRPEVGALIHYYETLTPAAINRLGDFYAADAQLKDPFNDVSGVPAIQAVLRRMFEQVEAPCFRFGNSLVQGDEAMLIWDFSYRLPLPLRLLARRGTYGMHGVSHLRFDTAGKVVYHRDYWDTAEELYEKLPGVGSLMRGLRRLAS